jgi:hypothetical protein
VSTAPDVTQPSISRVSTETQQKRGQPPVKCFLCNQTGHLGRSSANQGSRGNKLLAIEHKKVNFIGHDAHAKFFKTVALNGHKIKSFVDFRSECSLITAEAAKNLLLVIQPLERSVILNTHNGPSLKPKTCTRASVCIDGVVRNIIFYMLYFEKLRENGTNVESSLGPLKTVCRKIVANVRVARLGGG